MMRNFTATAALCLVLFLAHHSDAATVPLLEPTMIETETAQTTESVLRSDVDAETETEGSGSSLDEEEVDLSRNEESDTTESPETGRANDDNVTTSSTNIKSDTEEDVDNATVRSTNIESDKEEDIDISINLIREEEEETTSEKAPEEIQARSSSKNTDDEEQVTSRNAEADEDVNVVTEADEDIVTESSRTADEESTQVADATEVVETSSPFKAFFKLNITITSCGGNASEFSNVNQTLTLDELMNELNVTSEEIETTFEEIGDTLTEAVNQTMEAFGSLFSGMLDVISSPMPEIRPLISVNTREGAGPFNIPGIFSVNTNRKDGSLMAIEEGENTRVRIPGILHLKVGEDTIEGKNSVDTTFTDSEHLIHVKAEAGSAHIKAPYMDLKFGAVANKKTNKVTLNQIKTVKKSHDLLPDQKLKRN